MTLVTYIKQAVLKALLPRLGTIAATALLVGGDKLCADLPQTCSLVTPDGVNQVMTWVVAAAMVAFDVAVTYLTRKKGGQ